MSYFRLKLRSCVTKCLCTHWTCWHRWRGWLKPVILGVYILVLGAVLPVLIYRLYNAQERDVRLKLWFVAGLFALLTLPVFLMGVLQHILNYTRPHLQKHIIRILWVVPIYSLNSWLAIQFMDAAIYLDTLRECYEAYVLYNFLCYLFNYLTSEYDVVEELDSRPVVGQPIPWCCFPPWPKGRRFMRWCKVGVLQYTVVRVLVTIVALITQLTHVYKKGELTLKGNAYVYLSIVNVISQAIALHSLIYFYKGTRDLLKPLHPIGKFLSIKAIVFAMFWQAVLIALLIKVNAIPSYLGSEDELLQNFMVVLEMFLFAVAHYFIFSHRPYVDAAAAQVPCIAACLRMLDIRDVAGDVKEHFVDPLPRPKLHQIIKRSAASSSSNPDSDSEKRLETDTENSPLLKNKQDRRGSSVEKEEKVHGGGGLSTLPGGSSRSGQQHLAERSYEVLSYKEFDGRYSSRSRLSSRNASSERENDSDRMF